MAKQLRVLGIDPGIRGGVAWYEPGDLFSLLAPGAVDAIDVPIIGSGAQKVVDVENLCAWINKAKCDHAYIELISPSPTWSRMLTARFFRAYGALEACIRGCGLKPKYVTPVSWMREIDLLRKGKPEEWNQKDASRELMMKTIPMYAFLFERERDHNKAQACLIAMYGARRHQESQAEVSSKNPVLTPL